MASNKDIRVFGSDYGNYSLLIKRIFLGFLQGYFSLHPRFTWNVDQRISDILILDKYAYNIDVADKKPAIVLGRRNMSFINSSIGQRSSIDFLKETQSYTDLLQSGITFDCVSKSGLQAEEIATILLNVLTGYKKMLKSEGIHQISSLGMGEERLLKHGSEVMVTTVPVTIGFFIQPKLDQVTSYNHITITKTANYLAPEYNYLTPPLLNDGSGKSGPELLSGEVTYTLLEGEEKEYIIDPITNSIVFNTPPEPALSVVDHKQVEGEGLSDGTKPYPVTGSLIIGHPTYTVTYVSAVTLQENTFTIQGDGNQTTWDTEERIYGYGAIPDKLLFTSSDPSLTIQVGGDIVMENNYV